MYLMNITFHSFFPYTLKLSGFYFGLAKGRQKLRNRITNLFYLKGGPLLNALRCATDCDNTEFKLAVFCS